MRNKNILKVLIFTISCLLIPFNTLEAETIWHIETVDSVGDVGWYTSLALDSSGNTCDDNPNITELRPAADGHYNRSYGCCGECGCMEVDAGVVNRIVVNEYTGQIDCGIWCGSGYAYDGNSGIIELILAS